MARDILWPTMFEMGGDLITNSNVNNLDLTLVNGSKIGLRGSDEARHAEGPVHQAPGAGRGGVR